MSFPLTDFTPVASALGGAMIGLSAVILMAGLGRVAGISGIIGGLLPGLGDSDWGWRAAFVVGAVAAPVTILALTGAFPTVTVAAGPAALVASGLLVGIGAALGSGCTSGHGICGMARLSVRSIAATLTFMATTAATVFVVRHVVGG